MRHKEFADLTCIKNARSYTGSFMDMLLARARHQGFPVQEITDSDARIIKHDTREEFSLFMSNYLKGYTDFSKVKVVNFDARNQV